jgi:DNA-binding response OmpR family regulator/anti-sigma regulatory factor (Ser/Thr protein kinase)
LYSGQCYFDKDALEKILFNLLSNAIKFTAQQGKVEVTIQQSKNNILQIIVADTGIGIAAKDLKHVFKRFYKSEENNKQGTGIGLSLVKDLIALHGGSIQVKSEKNKGTVFTIEIPFETNPYIIEHIEISDEINSENTPTILIVEDNAEMIEYISSILKNENYNITKANNGVEAFKKAQEYIPDVVVTDVMMPDMDGNELTAKLKSTLATNHIPVIMLTAKSSLNSKFEGLEKGADIFLTKPFAAKELLLQIKNLLATQERLHEAYQRTAVVEPSEEAIASRSSVLDTNDKFVQQVIEQVLLRLNDENFSIEELAEKIFLSRTQLHRKLKAITGLSASQLMRTVRLEKAMELLQANAANVTEAAYQTGFSSQSYFTKCFSEHFGFAPSEVKKGN